MNGRVRVVVHGYASGGEGVARSGGLVLFVRGGVRGDEADVEIVSREKSFARAEIRELISPSPHRAEPDCPHFPACGGCDFRHMTYAEELFLKQTRLSDALFRIGGLHTEPETVVPAPEENHTRNKAVFHVGEAYGRRVIGFYGASSHDIVPVSSCRLLSPSANAALAAVSRMLIRCPELFGGLKSVQTRSARSGDLQLSLFMSRAADAELEAARAVAAELPQLSGMYLFEDGRGRLIYGDRHLRDTLCGLSFELGPETFYQVNPGQAEALYGLVGLYAGELENKSALDLFCGVGTITLYLARNAAEAAGIELSKRTVLDARRNARKNGLQNTVFFHGDASAAGDICAGLGLRPDVTVADPPRCGLGRAALSAIAELGSPRVVYVSCDPATLARDARALCGRGYRLARLAAVDMFPRTANVESVCLFEKAV